MAITGHKEHSVYAGTYGKAYGVNKLKEVIETLDFSQEMRGVKSWE